MLANFRLELTEVGPRQHGVEVSDNVVQSRWREAAFSALTDLGAKRGRSRAEGHFDR